MIYQKYIYLIVFAIQCCRVDRKNYRPVSLTSIVCKVMDGVIRDVFMGFLVKKQADLREAACFCCRKELCHELTRNL